MPSKSANRPCEAPSDHNQPVSENIRIAALLTACMTIAFLRCDYSTTTSEQQPFR
jgi:hypothetical protein